MTTSLVTFFIAFVCIVVQGRAEGSFDEREGKPTSRKESVLIEAFASIKEGYGYMFVEIQLGTPPQKSYAILDTSSSINLVPNNTSYFNSNTSSTFVAEPCSSETCRAIKSGANESSCNTEQAGTCIFCQTLGGAVAIAQLGRDKVVIGLEPRSNVSMDDFEFGLVDSVNRYADSLRPIDQQINVLALGKGQASFVAKTMQLYNGHFSHCFPPYASDAASPQGYIRFGNSHKAHIHYTPLFIMKENDQYPYYVDLHGISVDGIYISMPKRNATVIDSATYVTVLPQPVFNSFVKAYTAVASTYGMIPVTNLYNFSSPSSPCYRKMTEGTAVPTVKLHLFGLDISLDSLQTLWEPLHPRDDSIVCLAFASPSNSTVEPNPREAVIGNFQLQQKLVIYDTSNSRLGFRDAC